MLFVDLVSSIGGLLPMRGNISIDTPICKLHYIITSTLLLGSCVLVTATNLIGEPILCTFGDHSYLKENVINSYCWIHSTYTMATKYHSSTSMLHPGVGPSISRYDERVYHSYYQWVPFVLFLQAIMFYVPHLCWSISEGGKVSSASQELQSLVMNKDDRRDRIQLLADYLYASLQRHNMYAIKFLMSEFGNFINTVFNIWLLNTFLNGKFISYGGDFFSFRNDASRTDDGPDLIHPKLLLFPRMTKCEFRSVGPSGTIELLDSLCVLPHSIINEKVYLLLWVWLWILLIVTIFGLIWRCFVFFVPFVRRYLLTTYVQDLNKNDIHNLSSKLQLGDYFLLYLLQKNVTNMAFSDLVKELSDRIAGKGSNSVEMDEKVPPGLAPKGPGYFLMNEHR